ncbi:MAG TPA: FAD-dependent monooxygenase [Bryobacteraceae bacterium]|nr:FAD-dependent monooxygenase [Bryobacteraceae bacterium]
MQQALLNGLKPNYDAAVFGKGPAACIFAIRMARCGGTVLLVPPLTKSSPKPWGETLAPRGEFLLAQLGLVDQCLAGQHVTQTTLSCWLTPRLDKADLAFDPHGRMWHLNRPTFDHALLAHAVHSGAHILDRNSRRVSGISRQAGHWQITLASSNGEHTIQVEHLVDATGRSHSLARAMGATRILRDPLIALFCITEELGPDISPLLIEPVSQGWWYSLGLPQGQFLAAFITDPKLLKLSAETRQSVWDAMLDDAPYTRNRISASTNMLNVVSAESARLDQMSGEGWLAIGDAAMSFDPLSSHGLCSAIEQAMHAAEILLTRGEEAALSEFEAKRKHLFGKYTAQRRAFYRSVQRFSGYPFWQNRMLC